MALPNPNAYNPEANAQEILGQPSWYAVFNQGINVGDVYAQSANLSPPATGKEAAIQIMWVLIALGVFLYLFYNKKI